MLLTPGKSLKNGTLISVKILVTSYAPLVAFEVLSDTSPIN
ncbi:hypothetical protein [Colwellia sp.]|nr:hypothetical protein [Colwellia sp.]